MAAYNRVNWKESPDKSTPINATNLNNMDRGIFNNASDINEMRTDLTLQTHRIDEIAKLPEGSTTADAELVDIRVGWDGSTYESAGIAVRSQFEDVDSQVQYLRNRANTAFNIATTANDKANDALSKEALDRAMIKSIIGDYYYEEVNTGWDRVKYVPEDAFPFAALLEMGGMSRKCRQLLDVTKGVSDDVSMVSLVDKDIVFTNNFYVAMRYSLTLKANTDYTLVTNVQLTSGEAFFNVTVNNTELVRQQKSTNGLLTATFNTSSYTNILIAFCGTTSTSSGRFSQIMLYEGAYNENIPYEPYTDQLLDSKVDDRVSKGRNILNPSGYNSYSVTNQWHSVAILQQNIVLKSGKTYTLSFDTENTGIACYVNTASGFKRIDFTCDGTRKTVTTTFTQDVDYSLNTIPLVSRSQATSSVGTGILSNVMIAEGTATPYTPYNEKHYPIPQAIQDLPDYGIGISAELNNQVVVDPKTYHNMKSVDLGTLDWKYEGTRKRFYVTLPQSVNINPNTMNILSLDYFSTTWTKYLPLELDRCVATVAESNVNYLGIRDLRYDNIADFKSAMSGVILHYEATSGGSDYEAKLYHRSVGSKNLGDLNFVSAQSAGGDWFAYYDGIGAKNIESSQLGNILCARYKTITADESYIGVEGIAIAGNYLYICDHSMQGDASRLIQSLQGAMLYYELATEEVYDITEIMPDDFEIMQVEGGGTVEFHYPNYDDYNVDVQSDIAYQFKA